jgi:16S rRNA (cytidine1402-2'-O)-methyltransferase
VKKIRNKPIEGEAGSKLPAALYVVATPIGNLGDVTLRGLDTLRRADLVAAEDTRVTRRLLSAHGIRARLFAYHDHNAERVRPELLERLASGQSVALVSDAGTPLVSDPGLKLVQAAIAAGIPIVPVPGASAVLAAIMAAGLPTDRFTFAGFAPSGRKDRRIWIEELAGLPTTLVLFESTRRLARTLADLAAHMPGRAAAVLREITKLFEEARRGTLEDLAAHYAAAGPPKGEIAIVIGPASKIAKPEPAGELQAMLREALGRGSLRDAVDEVAARTGRKRREVYAEAIALDPRRAG